MIDLMIDGKRIASFRERWGLAITQEKEFLKFRNRVSDLIDEHLAVARNSDAFIKSYASLLGKARHEIEAGLVFHSVGHVVTDSTQTYPELMEKIQMLSWSLLETGYRDVAKRFAAHLKRVMALSPGLHAEVLISRTDISILPAGAKLLDENVVEEVLEWLKGYSNVGKHFFEALKIYSAKDTTKFRNLLDNLRFALEQMLRVVLGNQKSLENQKVEALQWLASHNIHAHVTNMYNDLIGKFAAYQNDAVKHNERYSPVEIEFMIYLTGTFLRLLVQLHREGASDKKKAQTEMV
jgi:hypothetical protein